MKPVTSSGKIPSTDSPRSPRDQPAVNSPRSPRDQRTVNSPRSTRAASSPRTLMPEAPFGVGAPALPPRRLPYSSAPRVHFGNAVRYQEIPTVPNAPQENIAAPFDVVAMETTFPASTAPTASQELSGHYATTLEHIYPPLSVRSPEPNDAPLFAMDPIHVYPAPPALPAPPSTLPMPLQPVPYATTAEDADPALEPVTPGPVPPASHASTPVHVYPPPREAAQTPAKSVHTAQFAWMALPVQSGFPASALSPSKSRFSVPTSATSVALKKPSHMAEKMPAESAAPYPFPKVSYFSGAPTQFKALIGDYTSMLPFFTVANLGKEQKNLKKQVRDSRECRMAQKQCKKIAKILKETASKFKKEDFKAASALAQEVKQLDIDLNTLILNAKGEGQSYDIQNYWESAGIALAPCSAALSKLVTLCDNEVNKRQFQPGKSRSGTPVRAPGSAKTRLPNPAPESSRTEARDIPAEIARMGSAANAQNLPDTAVPSLQTQEQAAQWQPASTRPVLQSRTQPSRPPVRPPPLSPPPPLPPQYALNRSSVSVLPPGPLMAPPAPVDLPPPVIPQSHGAPARPAPATPAPNPPAWQFQNITPAQGGGRKRAASRQLTPEHSKSAHTDCHLSPGAGRNDLGDQSDQQRDGSVPPLFLSGNAETVLWENTLSETATAMAKYAETSMPDFLPTPVQQGVQAAAWQDQGNPQAVSQETLAAQEVPAAQEKVMQVVTPGAEGRTG